MRLNAGALSVATALAVAAMGACGSDDPSPAAAGPHASAGTAGAAATGGSGGITGGTAGSGGTGGSAPDDGGVDSSTDAAGDAPATGVGPAGGTVTGPGGAEAVVPPGALSNTVPIGIAEDATGAPVVPAKYEAIGPVLAFTPHGTAFATPVTVKVPFDGARLPSGESALLLKAEPGGAFAEIPATREGTTAVLSAPVSAFSWFVAARDASRGGLRVVIDAEANVIGQYVTTGPAGSVYVTGSTPANLDGAHGSGQSTCFIAKLTVALSFEWVKQVPACRANPVVGPTGNLFVLVHSTAVPAEVELTSLTPSGDVRSGFPVTIAPSTGTGALFPSDVAVDGQDNVTLLGYQQFGASSGITSRAFVASYTGSGQARGTPGLVDFGTTGNVYTFPTSLALNSAGAWLSANFEDATTPTSVQRGYFVHLLGGARTGFPIQVPHPPQTNLSYPIALVPLPGTEDMMAFGSALGASQPPTLIRYQGTGAIAAGFPKPLVTGTEKEFAFAGVGDHRAVAADTQGNVYVLARLDDAESANDIPEVAVLSYTADAALRAGYPISVGSEPRAGGPSHPMTAIFVDGTGTIYLVGDDPHTTVATRRSLVIQRLPAR